MPQRIAAQLEAAFKPTLVTMPEAMMATGFMVNRGGGLKVES